MRYLIIIFLFIMTLHSCFEDEEMVPPHEQGDLAEGQAAMGPNYGTQVFFDLHDNREVSSNALSDWDLSFESANGGWSIRLNSAQFMLAGNSNDTLFNADLVMEDLNMKFDKSDGHPDSTAIGSWFGTSEDSLWSYRHVYLVDRGSDELGTPIGIKKVQFDILGDKYLVRYSNADNSQDTTVTIDRDPVMERVYFSFENGVMEIAPEPDQWSLLFTRYTTMLVTDEGEDYPYLVVGVLLNPNGVAAVRDTIHPFMDLNSDDLADQEFTTQSDVIGYEWKDYDFDAGVYTIVPDMTYVIRDRDGFFYKLRFVDFYSDLGVKGYPKFEFVRL
jgi:hypothetical protein